MELLIECDCGWTVRDTVERVIPAAQQHGRDVHQLELTREQVLAAAKPAPAA